MVNVDQVGEKRLGNNNRSHSRHYVQRRESHPENAHEPYMFADPAAPKLDESEHGLAATYAAWLSRLQLRTALIAKH